MNYKHAYHAGNFADCFKHALLIVLLDALGRKATPYFVLDSHAGAGHYDIMDEAARRTGESDGGILRLLDSRPEALSRYLSVVNAVGLYPGSPAIIRHMMRAGDRLACCDTEPEPLSALRRLFADDRRIHVHQRSGWEAVGALLPPREKRGLCFVDPPFEDAGEFNTLSEALAQAHRRFAQGMFAGWYPIKRLAAVRAFYESVRRLGIPDIVAVELRLRPVTDASRFNGCGLLIVNPPFQFEVKALEVARAVLAGLGTGEGGSGTEVIRLADE
jgi:23S rRNA (adenine2030-N6)-methyltransferase